MDEEFIKISEILDVPEPNNKRFLSEKRKRGFGEPKEEDKEEKEEDEK